MNRLRLFYALLKSAARGASEDKVPMMGAALAYYAVFSIAPLLVISLGVAGLVFGDRSSDEIFSMILGLVGPNGASAVEAMVAGASRQPRAGVIATVLGIIMLMAGASGVFQQLQEALKVIWKVSPKTMAGWRRWPRQRLLSWGMVIVIALVLLASMIASVALAAMGKFMGGSMPGGQALWQAVNFAVSAALSGFFFAAIFKVLPDAPLRWRDALVGGFFTAVLFSFGKFGIGMYLGRSGVSSAYGAAGSLIVILLWVFYTAQILLFGAEFTRAYAARRRLTEAAAEG